jgi:O-antigen/teichoic acid export membrane protein
MEFLTQPVLMIITAPFLVSRLGADQYGIWMLVSALAGTIGVFQIGLGDATIKYVSSYRGREDSAGVSRIIRGTLSLSILLGGITALAVFLVAPYCVRHIFKIEPQNVSVAITCIRLGGVLLWIQSISFVFANSLKAYESYGPPVKIAAFLKTATIVTAVILVASGHSVVAVMLATLGVTLLGIGFLASATRRVISRSLLLPTFDRRTWREVFHFGFYSWIQGAAGLVFSQADKLLIAATLGAGSLTYYTLCVQVAQQIHGLPGAVFSFLFPHISARHESGNKRNLKKTYYLAVLANAVLSVTLTLPLVVLSKRILTIWMGADFAAHSYAMFSVLAAAFCVVSLNVAPHYTLLGLGKVRFISFVNLAGGALSLVGAAVLIPSLGLFGAAAGRLFYGPVISANYLKVAKSL